MSRAYPLVRPILFALDPELAHRSAVLALRYGAIRARGPVPSLPLRLWGLSFPNPIGMAAGFDKDAEVADRLLGLGFGFAEVGSVTPRPQPGNPKPRVFRLIRDRAMINRFGFNSAGARKVAENLRRLRAAGAAGIIGVNLGRNKDSADAGDDYAEGVAAFATMADYLVVNVSSPNTPGLRTLQDPEKLVALLQRVRDALSASCDGAESRRPPLLLKIAPDLTAEDRVDIATVVREQRLDGLIVSNTTVARPASLRDAARNETGGLSGAPLFAPSTALLAEMFRRTDGEIPLIGVGGVASGADAYAKIRAGASLVQLYTGLVYEGPGLVARILSDLAALLARDGFGSVAEAVGTAAEA